MIQKVFDSPKKLRDAEEFLRDARDGTLPAFSWLNPRWGIDMVKLEGAQDQHPDHDVRLGEALIKEVYEALRSGPKWNETLLVITYDEHGGFYDHVAPPMGVPAPDASKSFPDEFDFTRLGLRIPVLAISPWLPRGMMRNMFSMNNQSMQILAIEPQSALQNSAALPAMLGTVPHVDAGSADRPRQFTLTMMMGMGMGRGGGRGGQGMAGGNFFINNTRMDMDVINHRIPVGSTEVWRITNDSMMMHPFHVHHNQFSIISRNNRPAPLWERALKDTVKIAPGETVEIAMRFENFADPENPYMYHCHILEHEDNGMMGQFVVE